MRWNPDDIHVIIRSVGERTEEACRHSILRQGIPDFHIETIRVSPFHQAQRICCETAIKVGCTWSVFIDADIILFDGALESAFHRALGQNYPNLYGFQPFTYDKFRIESNTGGPHIYLTKHLSDALTCIPGPESTRPESTMNKTIIRKKNLVMLWLDVAAGHHGSHQYFRDILRTHFHKGLKHPMDFVSKHEKLFMSKCSTDNDYFMALAGIRLGSLYKGSGGVSTQVMDSFYSVIAEKPPILELAGLVTSMQFRPSTPPPPLSVISRSSLKGTQRLWDLICKTLNT